MANPFSQDSTYWQAALELYHLDELEEAYRQIMSHGVGDGGWFLRWYRVIEAEAMTRARSEVMQVAPWLSIELVSSEILDLRGRLIQGTIAACDEIALRLGWTHGAPTRLAILAEEADAPWAANPFGYCVTKEPFEKICLPSYLVDDPDEFFQAVAHEYAHVISLNLSDGFAPRWLEETVSVLAERQFDDCAVQAFASGHEPWLSPEDLELTIENAREEEGRDAMWMAYQQAGLIGRYLTSIGGERMLGTLLREHANESVTRNLKLIVTGQDRLEGALQAVYGLTKRRLFAEALTWVSSGAV
jgi:hypothetical protein